MSVETLAAWWAVHSQFAREARTPIDLALQCGMAADRVGWAFASGYQAASTALFGTSPTVPTALCVTEKGGVHPRAIETTLALDADGSGTLHGEKAFVTFGEHAIDFLVLAVTGTRADGRKAFRMAHIARASEGVEVTPHPTLPFAPEIPHAAVRFVGAKVAQGNVLEGDGWEKYVRPFRTVEDIYVHAALAGYLLGVAQRSSWAPAAIEAVEGISATFRSLAAEDASSPATHLALADAIAALHAWLASSAEWRKTDAQTRTRWERDRPLLSVADKARAARLEAARGV